MARLLWAVAVSFAAFHQSLASREPGAVLKATYFSAHRGRQVRTGSVGSRSLANNPGIRGHLSGWHNGTDFLIFGGAIVEPTEPEDFVNGEYDFPFCFHGSYDDVWAYREGGGWAWVTGSTSMNATPYYAVRGEAGPLNTPGGRHLMMTTFDGQRLWMFGGLHSMDAFGQSRSCKVVVVRNDLWSFADGLWTYHHGPEQSDVPGVYGELGVASPDNLPGPRAGGATWHRGRQLWMFGGVHTTYKLQIAVYNDLWMYDMDTSLWTWVSGPSGINADLSTYPGMPNGRYEMAVVDSGDSLLMFGGTRFIKETMNFVHFNDLWRLVPENGSFAMLSGAPNASGVGARHGELYDFSSRFVPGGRGGPLAWTDDRRLYVFGGVGFTTNTLVEAILRDAWAYDMDSGNWSWVGGHIMPGAERESGMCTGPLISSQKNLPTPRYGSAYAQSGGRVWIYGGFTWMADSNMPTAVSDLWALEMGPPNAAPCVDDVSAYWSPRAVAAAAVVLLASSAGLWIYARQRPPPARVAISGASDSAGNVSVGSLRNSDDGSSAGSGRNSGSAGGASGGRASRSWTLARPADGAPRSDLLKDLPVGMQVIPVDVIQIQKKLGGGAFGDVYLARMQNTSHVAVKRLRDEALLQDFLKEAVMLTRCKHPNVVNFIGLHVDAIGEHYIVMEYLALGSLDRVLRAQTRNGTVTWTHLDLMEVMKHAAAGMAYLEEHGIIHRDLACRNLLASQIVDQVTNTAKYYVKVSDFGMARQPGEDMYYNTNSKVFPVRWTAPESLSGKFSTKSDVWSMGVTLWETFSYGKIPYRELANDKVADHVRGGNLLPQPDDCPDSIYNIMKLCWNFDPHARPTFKEILPLITNAQREAFGEADSDVSDLLSMELAAYHMMYFNSRQDDDGYATHVRQREEAAEPRYINPDPLEPVYGFTPEAAPADYLDTSVASAPASASASVSASDGDRSVSISDSDRSVSISDSDSSRASSSARSDSLRDSSSDSPVGSATPVTILDGQPAADADPGASRPDAGTRRRAARQREDSRAGLTVSID